MIQIFKGYIPFIVIIRYWLYFLWCKVYPCSLFILYIIVCTSYPLHLYCFFLFPLPTTNHLLVLYTCEFFIVLFTGFSFLGSKYMSNHTVFVFLYLTYFTNQIPSKSIHVVASGKISFFFIFNCRYMPYLLYPFIC